jgi:hypothetical protein
VEAGVCAEVEICVEAGVGESIDNTNPYATNSNKINISMRNMGNMSLRNMNTGNMKSISMMNMSMENIKSISMMNMSTGNMKSISMRSISMRAMKRNTVNLRRENHPSDNKGYLTRRVRDEGVT